MDGVCVLSNTELKGVNHSFYTCKIRMLPFLIRSVSEREVFLQIFDEMMHIAVLGHWVLRSYVH